MLILIQLEIDGWKANIKFSSAHLLPGHKKCGVLHGHTYSISAKISGEVNDQGFLVDFILLKSHHREIAAKLDHRILIPEKNKFVTSSSKEIIINEDKKKYVFPRVDCILLPITSATAENLADYVLSELIKNMELPKNIKKIEIGVDEGFGQEAWTSKVVG